MSIKFSTERWKAVHDTYALWWQGKLDRPLIKITVKDAFSPDVPKPNCPLLSQTNCHDFSVSAEEIIDAIDYELSQYEFLGDDFPFFNFDAFGPGVVAAFCGAKLDNSSGGVWFFPEEIQEIEDIHVKYDPQNKWAMRLKEIYRAGNKKWNGMVLMGLPDLGGVLDIMASFRESENLLFDLYDYPEEVDRLRKEIEIAWDEAFADMAAAIDCDRYGYTNWDGLYSATPAYVIQCDFSYMISNDMFREFALPSLEHHVARLDNVIYHLDGIGELNHLDDLLAMEHLNAIQWVFGDGQPDSPHWIDSVYKKIESAGKGSHICGTVQGFDAVSKQIGKGLYFSTQITNDQRDSIKHLL